MRAAGVELIEHVEQLAVMGFVEVLKHVPRHWRAAARRSNGAFERATSRSSC